MKVIVAGYRRYKDYERVKLILDQLHALMPITEVVSGCASGADSLGVLWASENDIPVRLFPADWKQYGRAAGPKRNKQMAEYADFLVAFLAPQSKGTKSMIREAEKVGMPGYIVSIQKRDN